MTTLTYLKFFFLVITTFSFQIYTICQERIFDIPDSSYFENLILDTDRELYIAGEKIWFNVDCHDNSIHSKPILSRIAYVELYDYELNAISKGKFRIVEGAASGFVNIPEGIVSGNYYIRVYTHFLRNYSPYLFPSSLISIINPLKPEVKEDAFLDEILIQPEGGGLVVGIKSKLAIRVNHKLNKRLYKLTVLDGEKKKLRTFTPYSNGLAMVEFKPENTEQHFLELTFSDSSIMLKPLPIIKKTGLVLQSSCKNLKLEISLSSNPLPVNVTKNGYKIEIWSKSLKSILVRSIKLGELIEISPKMIPEGIIYVILKNNNDEIVHISSKFISKVIVKGIKIKRNKDVFEPRELVELEIEQPPDSSHVNKYMVSVVKRGTVNEMSKSIPAYITYSPVLLSNYLKTRMVDSGSFSEQINITTILYSRIYNSIGFKRNFQKNVKTIWFPEIRDVSISGKVVDKRTKEPLNNVMVYSSVFGENNQHHIYKTRLDGLFFFSLNHLAKKQNVFICVKPEDSLRAKILINTDFANDYPFTEQIPLDLDSSDRKLLNQLYFNYQVNRAFDYRVEKAKESLYFNQLPEESKLRTIYLKDYVNIPVMAEVFDEIIPFVTARKNGKKYYLKVYDDKNEEFYNNPLVLIDGIPIFNINEIMKISTDLVEKIDVINRRYHLGDFILNGVIRITTKTKNFAGISFPKEAVFIEYQAVTPEVFMVQTNYLKERRESRVPDFRNLLYWNPNLCFESENKKIKFYTSDHNGEYDIIVKAYSNNKLYYGSVIIRVKK